MKYCSKCGASLNDDAVFCSKCGSPVEGEAGMSNYASYETAPVPKDNGMAIAGFVLSFLIPILGLIFSCVGFSKSRTVGKGKGLSIAGIIISVASFVVNFIMVLTVFSQAGA